ncbi:MAG: hypothetical protein JJV98_14065 [Desulfosarcina sp.]|nr:hypothetical protein [Desulfobacterales bacterium]
MRKPANGLGYNPLETSGAGELANFGYFGLDTNIARALGKRSHLGYISDDCPWEAHHNDFGYYAINGGISRALKRLARR